MYWSRVHQGHVVLWRGPPSIVRTRLNPPRLLHVFTLLNVHPHTCKYRYAPALVRHIFLDFGHYIACRTWGGQGWGLWNVHGWDHEAWKFRSRKQVTGKLNGSEVSIYGWWATLLGCNLQWMFGRGVCTCFCTWLVFFSYYCVIARLLYYYYPLYANPMQWEPCLYGSSIRQSNYIAYAGIQHYIIHKWLFNYNTCASV